MEEVMMTHELLDDRFMHGGRSSASCLNSKKHPAKPYSDLTAIINLKDESSACG